MASNFPLKTSLLLLCLLPQLSVSTPSQETTPNAHHHLHQVHGLEIGKKISSALSDKGYLAMSIILEGVAMSIILEGALSSLVPLNVSHNTRVTIFCPPDKAFFSPKYPQPPFTLLQYHIVPFKIERETFESSLQYQLKIDTLLPGHPLVDTTTPHSSRASLNDVKVKEWDIYNDGRVIVHGVEDFFDPAFQTLLYPWYDTNNNDNDNEINNGVHKTVSSKAGSVSVICRMKDMMMDKLMTILAVVAFVGAFSLLHAFIGVIVNRVSMVTIGHKFIRVSTTSYIDS